MAAPPLKLEMTPPTGERLLRFVGDRVRFTLRSADGEPLPRGWRGLLRTNLGRGAVLRREIITSRGGERPMTGASWRDIPMRRENNEWFIELTLTEVGYFKAKAYARSEEHTSELQSRGHLVCRLLLEKKKKKINKYIIVMVISYR